jgi:hypothetical protein
MPELFNPPAINRSKSPTARHSDDTGLHHGETIPDPYRWLEDSTSPETKAWVAAQNELTQAWLARVPTRTRSATGSARDGTTLDGALGIAPA